MLGSATLQCAHYLFIFLHHKFPDPDIFAMDKPLTNAISSFHNLAEFHGLNPDVGRKVTATVCVPVGNGKKFDIIILMSVLHLHLRVVRKQGKTKK